MPAGTLGFRVASKQGQHGPTAPTSRIRLNCHRVGRPRSILLATLIQPFSVFEVQSAAVATKGNGRLNGTFRKLSPVELPQHVGHEGIRQLTSTRATTATVFTAETSQNTAAPSAIIPKWRWKARQGLTPVRFK